MENQSTPTPQELAQAQNQSDYQTIAEEISEAKVLLNNTLKNDTILATMANTGYPKTTIEAQVAKLDAVEKLNNEQLSEYGEQYNATEDWYTARAALHPAYIAHLGLARIQFKGNKGAHNALSLNGRRKLGQADYASQALSFYNNITTNPDYATAMKNNGVTAEVIAAAVQGYEGLQPLREAQDKETGEAQRATAKRNAAFDEVMEFVDEYRAKAKIVLASTPQIMEELGIKDPS